MHFKILITLLIISLIQHLCLGQDRQFRPGAPRPPQRPRRPLPELKRPERQPQDFGNPGAKIVNRGNRPPTLERGKYPMGSILLHKSSEKPKNVSKPINVGPTYRDK